MPSGAAPHARARATGMCTRHTHARTSSVLHAARRRFKVAARYGASGSRNGKWWHRLDLGWCWCCPDVDVPRPIPRPRRKKRCHLASTLPDRARAQPCAVSSLPPRPHAMRGLATLGAAVLGLLVPATAAGATARFAPSPLPSLRPARGAHVGRSARGLRPPRRLTDQRVDICRAPGGLNSPPPPSPLYYFAQWWARSSPLISETAS